MSFQVGDVVKVAREGVTHDPNGMGFCKPWKNNWVEEQTANVGLHFTIEDIDPELGVFFKERDSENLNGLGSYGYPLNVLDPVELVAA
jgi:hypothetical protein